MDGAPQTLQEAVQRFSDPNKCRDYVAAWRWPDGVVKCPVCGKDKPTFLPNQDKWQCRSHHSKRQFSVKVGTIFEDSGLGLDKWLVAMWLIANCKNGISSCEIARALGVTQKTAWFMDHRIRRSMQDDFCGDKLGGPGAEIEVDESFIGGKARNMHISERKRRITGTGGKDKTAVMGILERGGKIRLKVVPNRRKKALQTEVRSHVAAGSALYSDALKSYDGLEQEYAHKIIDHAERYVDGRVHTNGLENFWSLLFHLFRYLDEQAFRFNNRKATDADRFNLALMGAMGKRVTFRQVTGKDNGVPAEL